MSQVLEIAQRRELLLMVYGEALDAALQVAEELKGAIDRLVEIDAIMVDVLGDGSPDWESYT